MDANRQQFPGYIKQKRRRWTYFVSQWNVSKMGSNPICGGFLNSDQLTLQKGLPETTWNMVFKKGLGTRNYTKQHKIVNKVSYYLLGLDPWKTYWIQNHWAWILKSMAGDSMDDSNSLWARSIDSNIWCIPLCIGCFLMCWRLWWWQFLSAGYLLTHWRLEFQQWDLRIQQRQRVASSSWTTSTFTPSLGLAQSSPDNTSYHQSLIIARTVKVLLVSLRWCLS